MIEPVGNEPLLGIPARKPMGWMAFLGHVPFGPWETRCKRTHATCDGSKDGLQDKGLSCSRDSHEHGAKKGRPFSLSRAMDMSTWTLHGCCWERSLPFLLIVV